MKIFFINRNDQVKSLAVQVSLMQKENVLHVYSNAFSLRNSMI